MLLYGWLALPLSVFPTQVFPIMWTANINYAATPEYFAESARKFADRGARIIGGCCGTTPEHIAAIAAALNGYVPSRELAAADRRRIRPTGA